MRVAELLRQSTKKQGRRKTDDEVDIPGQRLAIAEFLATKPDWQLVKGYEEKGVSAFKKTAEERDVLQQAHRDAKAGLWDVLVVFKHDRLSRQPVDYLKGLERFEAAGVKVWSVADNKWLSMDDDEIILRFMEGYVANRSSKDTAQRVAPRMRQIARDGRWTGGHVPFGYTLQPKLDAAGAVVLRGDRIEQALVPNDDAHLIQEVYERYLHGTGTPSIARWVNGLGGENLRAKVWSAEAIRKILQNPVYCGWIGYLYGRTGREKGETPILVEGLHPAIITKDTWDRTQATFAHRKKVPARQRCNNYALTGIIRCGECGAAVGGITRKAAPLRSVERQAYRCLDWKHKGTCSNSNMDGATLEANFVAALEEQFNAPTGLRTFLEQREEASKDTLKADAAARKQAQKRLQEVDGALKRLDRAYLEAGTVTDGEYSEKKTTYQAERRQLEEDLARPAALSEAKDIGELVETVKQLRVLWYDEETTTEERKALALGLVKAWGLKVLAYRDKRVVIRPDEAVC